MLVQAKPLAHGALDVVTAIGTLGYLLAYHQAQARMRQAVGPGIHLEQVITARVPQMKNG